MEERRKGRETLSPTVALEGLFEKMNECSEGLSRAKTQRRAFQAEGAGIQRLEARPVQPKQSEEGMAENAVGRG